MIQTTNQYNKLIRPIVLVNRVISIWPLQDNTSSLSLFFTTTFKPFHRSIMFLFSGTMSLAVTFDITKNWGDMNEVTECLLISTAFYLSLLRLIVYTVHADDFEYVVQTMENDWNQMNASDVEILKDKCLFAIELAKKFIITVLLAGGAFAVVPMLEVKLLGAEKVLPFRGYFFQNQTEYYNSLYVATAFMAFFPVLSIAGCTSLNLVLVMHGSAKFSVVREKLEAIKSTDPHDKMAECVQLHQKAITFAERIESTINQLVLGQFVISAGLICFAGFQLTAMIEDKGRLLKYASFLNSAILELFLFCYSGNEIITESEGVGESSYKSGWIGGELKQYVCIIMLRSSVPCKITAAKFSDMSLMSFSSVLSTSFSYLTVLQSVNE